MKKIITAITVGGATLLGNALAQIRVQVPTAQGGSNQEQVATIGQNITSEGDLRISLVQLANRYLRDFLIVVLVVVLIVVGFRLMSGKNENSGTALMNALIAILIAIFSYTIVRLLINLF